MDEFAGDAYVYLEMKNKELWETTPAELNVMLTNVEKKRKFDG